MVKVDRLDRLITNYYTEVHGATKERLEASGYRFQEPRTRRKKITNDEYPVASSQPVFTFASGDLPPLQ
jgi:hypothetical protein